MSGDPVARRMWRLVEPVHDVVYFTDEPRAAAAEAGYRGFWMGYVALRAAPLGAVGPEPVTALFHGFHPSRIRRALPDAWGFAGPDAAVRARTDGSAAALRRLLAAADVDPDGDPVAEAADLAWDAAAAVDVAGRALAAANRALPRPATPLAVLWQAATTLREHRGDGHVAVLVAHGVGPVAAHVLKTAAGEAAGELLRTARAWPDEAWDDAVAELRARGWVDRHGRLTSSGEKGRARIERATDGAAVRPWAVLGPDATDRLAELLATITAAVVDADVLPRGNPVGLVAARTPTTQATGASSADPAAGAR